MQKYYFKISFKILRYLLQIGSTFKQVVLWLQAKLAKVRLCSEPNKVIPTYHLLILIVVIKLRVCCYGDGCEVMISNSPHE